MRKTYEIQLFEVGQDTNIALLYVCVNSLLFFLFFGKWNLIFDDIQHELSIKRAFRVVSFVNDTEVKRINKNKNSVGQHLMAIFNQHIILKFFSLSQSAMLTINSNVCIFNFCNISKSKFIVIYGHVIPVVALINVSFNFS